MKRVPIHLVTEKMRLARPVFDREGLLVAGVGTVLTRRLLHLLRNLAIQAVPVDDNEPIPAWTTVPDLGGAVREIVERFGQEPHTPAMAMLRDAAVRRATRQAEDVQAAETLWHAPRPGRAEPEA